MYPQVVQFETRRLQMERELQLTREIGAARARSRDRPEPTEGQALAPTDASHAIVDRSPGPDEIAILIVADHATYSRPRHRCRGPRRPRRRLPRGTRGSSPRTARMR